MNKDVIGKALYFTAGLAVGGGTVYLVVRKRYRALAEEEIASVKDAFQRIADQKVAQAEADWRADQTGTEEEVDKRHGLKIVQNEDYNTVSEEVPEVVESVQVDVREEDEERQVTVTFAESKEPEQIERDPNTPYEIDVADFMTGTDMENVVYTYWELDDVLVDETDKFVDNGVEMIGDIFHLLKSEERKTRGQAIYVRNEKLGVDFEIELDPRSFSKTVLGVNEWDADDIREKVQTKKMRSDE